MGQVLVDSNSLTAIAEAIRSKNKQTVKYKPNEMAGAIKALALDNSVVIQSNDAWKYAVDPALEHQSITVKVNADLIGDNTTGYTSKTTFDPTIKSNFGYIAGKIKQTVDSTNHIINFSAGPVTETDKLIQDGWAPVYVIGDGSKYGYYTTTTPDDANSFKSISSSDNIENILICGYYTKDNSTGKLSPVDSDKNYVGKQLVSTYTKKIKNTYATSIGDSAFSGCSALTSIDVSNATSIGNTAFSDCSSLTSIDVSNATSIGDSAFYSCSALTSIDVSNATSIGDSAFSDCSSLTSIDVSNATSIGDSAFYSCSALTSIDVSNATSIGNSALANWSNPKLKYIVIDSNTVSAAHVQPWSGVKVLIPQSMMSAYAADSYWSSYTSYLDAIENYTITRENGQINVVDKSGASYSPNITYNGNMNVFLGDALTSDRKIFCISNRQQSEFSALETSMLIQESEFAIGYDPDMDMGGSNAGINNTNNFYNLDPNAKYKITNLKIGDTILTDADVSADNRTNKNEITSDSTKWFNVNTSGWFNSVYKQCTGIDLKERQNQIVDEPIISTIPVSITFTNVTQ